MQRRDQGSSRTRNWVPDIGVAEATYRSLLSESCVAFHTGREWTGRKLGIPTPPDVWPNIEVRALSGPVHLVPAKFKDDAPVVLCRCDPPEVVIVGWITVRAARGFNVERDPGTSGAAWEVPTRVLRPISELIVSR